MQDMRYDRLTIVLVAPGIATVPSMDASHYTHDLCLRPFRALRHPVLGYYRVQFLALSDRARLRRPTPSLTDTTIRELIVLCLRAPIGGSRQQLGRPAANVVPLPRICDEASQDCPGTIRTAHSHVIESVSIESGLLRTSIAGPSPGCWPSSAPVRSLRLCWQSRIDATEPVVQELDPRLAVLKPCLLNPPIVGDSVTDH